MHDITLLNSLIDYNPKFDLKSGLQDTYDKMSEYHLNGELHDE